MGIGSLIEREYCNRCGGSGEYSYNPMYGTVCFKCGGAKTLRTKRGQAAQDLATWLLSRRVADLHVGDVIQEEVGISQKLRWVKISELARQPDGTYKLQTDGCDYGFVDGNKTFRVAHKPPQKRIALWTALAFQSTLNKNGKCLRRMVAKAEYSAEMFLNQEN